MVKTLKRGRPRAIPPELETMVVSLYETGLGYRKIARVLKKEHGISADFATVRRLLFRVGRINERKKKD